MSKIFFILTGLIISYSSFGQVNRYMIFFSDKEGESYPYSINNPSEFLTGKSIERRAKQGIGIEESDLPVHPKYITNLRDLGIEVYFTSRWMNAALVQTSQSDVFNLEAHVYVDSVALIAEGERLSTSKIAIEISTPFEAPPSVTSNTSLQLSMLQADVMHAEGIKGQGMLIAVLDDGFLGVNRFQPFQHLWDDDQIVATKDFVENSGNVFRLGDHGTSVFSTIAAQYQDVFYGVAHEADFILCITEDGESENRVEEFNWLLGAEYADSLGADIINGSLGYRTFDIPEHNYFYEDLNGQTAVVSKAARMATDKGMVVVVAAGNSGSNAPWHYVSPPADADNILAVGSVNPDSTWTAFSSLGPTSDGRIKPDVASLGVNTAIVSGSGEVTRGSGTSFASPQIAGLVAGIWQINPAWTNLEVISSLKQAGHNAHDPDTFLGYGVPVYAHDVEDTVLKRG